MDPVVPPNAIPTSTPSPAARCPAERCDRWLGGPMFWLALAFLILAAGVLHRIGEGFSTHFEFEAISWALILLWPFFIVEALLRLVVCVRRDPLIQRIGYTVFVMLAPPLRMGSRSYADSARMWLPAWGWCAVDRHLRKRLERFFSVPMMVIAFLVLPVLAIEHFWVAEVRSHFAASLFLDIASSVIWMAFAAEFILMVSVADRKTRYCLQNWMDVAIVVLPLVDFMPLLRLLRLTRLLELQQLSRIGRLYRLRGLWIKLWRAVLLLDILSRLTGNRKQKRLLRLQELRTAKLEELTDLNKEIDDLERELAAAKSAAPAPAPAGGERAASIGATVVEPPASPGEIGAVTAVAVSRSDPGTSP
jgi:hypothetical protein